MNDLKFGRKVICETSQKKSKKAALAEKVSDYVMTLGCFVIAAYFAFSLSVGSTSTNADGAVAVFAQEDNAPGENAADKETFNVWEYLSDELEKYFTKKGLI